MQDLAIARLDRANAMLSVTRVSVECAELTINYRGVLESVAAILLCIVSKPVYK